MSEARSIDDPTGYWCVVCGRFIEDEEDGLQIHDAVDHPPIMLIYDDEEYPQ